MDVANPPSPVPREVVQTARDLSSHSGAVRSRAAWRLLRAGVLEHAMYCARTRGALAANQISAPAHTIDDLEICASILQKLSELQKDPDMRVRVAANEVARLVEAWEAIESGKVERPSLEGVPVQSVSVLRVYLDMRSHWLRPLARSVNRIWAAMYTRVLGHNSSKS